MHVGFISSRYKTSYRCWIICKISWCWCVNFLQNIGLVQAMWRKLHLVLDLLAMWPKRIDAIFYNRKCVKNIIISENQMVDQVNHEIITFYCILLWEILPASIWSCLCLVNFTFCWCMVTWWISFIFKMHLRCVSWCWTCFVYIWQQLTHLCWIVGIYCLVNAFRIVSATICADLVVSPPFVRDCAGLCGNLRIITLNITWNTWWIFWISVNCAGICWNAIIFTANYVFTGVSTESSGLFVISCLVNTAITRITQGFCRICTHLGWFVTNCKECMQMQRF